MSPEEGKERGGAGREDRGEEQEREGEAGGGNAVKRESVERMGLGLRMLYSSRLGEELLARPPPPSSSSVGSSSSLRRKGGGPGQSEVIRAIMLEGCFHLLVFESQERQ